MAIAEPRVRATPGKNKSGSSRRQPGGPSARGPIRETAEVFWAGRETSAKLVIMPEAVTRARRNDPRAMPGCCRLCRLPHSAQKSAASKRCAQTPLFDGSPHAVIAAISFATLDARPGTTEFRHSESDIRAMTRSRVLPPAEASGIDTSCVLVSARPCFHSLRPQPWGEQPILVPKQA